MSFLVRFSLLDALIAVDGSVFAYFLVFLIEVCSVCLVPLAGTVASYGSVGAMLMAWYIQSSSPLL